MLRRFRLSTSLPRFRPASRTQLYLAGGVLALALLNVVALMLCVAPPGGTRSELLQQEATVRRQLVLMNRQTHRLRTVSANIRQGSNEIGQFGTDYILPKRLAYSQVLEEIARMAKTAHIQEHDGIFSEEPIEGAPDLSLLNVTANYEGSYDSFMHFLYQVDASPMLLVLDNLQASPQKEHRQVNTSIRFQAIVRDTLPGVSQ